MLEAARRVNSPYETEARYSAKKGTMSRVGYKVYLIGSCDDEDLPNLTTSVRTIVATATDVKQLRAILEGLSRSRLLPAERLADAAYVCGSNLVSSHARQSDFVGPPYQDNTWQAKAKEGFDVAGFRVQWT
jgi:transposase